MTRRFLPLLLLGALACARAAQRPADLAPLRPAPAEIETFVGAALADRFAAGDIPDQELVSEQDPVFVFDEMERSAYRLGAAALPQLDDTRFALLTRTQARDLAYGRRGIALIEVDDVEIIGDQAKLTMGVSNYPDMTRDLHYGSGSGPAEFRRDADGEWSFVGWGALQWTGRGQRTRRTALAHEPPWAPAR
jgi:hypothetical protein